MKEAIISDIDGTLSILGNRSPYDYNRIYLDKPRIPVINVLKKFQWTHYIFLITGREEYSRENTIDWLKKNGVPYNDIFMRQNFDRRKDFIVKKELYKKYIQGIYNVLFVLEDRNQMVKFWRKIGLTCFQVADGNF